MIPTRIPQLERLLFAPVLKLSPLVTGVETDTLACGKAALACLQLTPGVPTVTQVLRALLSGVPVDALNTMGIPPDDPYAKFGEPPAWAEYRALAKEAGVPPIEPIAKWEFYKAVESADHVLTIQTADQALWANVLVTIGCRTPEI